MHARIAGIEYHLPETVLSTADLAREFPDWTVEKIDDKTGIQERHIAGPGECASDLAAAAARKLFESGVCQPEDIDFVLFCSQSPDYFLPATACIIQDRLGLPVSCGAYDFNLGCSGYIYGLGQAEGLIASGQAERVLLLTADTYTRFIEPGDRSVRTIFGDAAAATLLTATDTAHIGPFVYGTDGSGAENLIVKNGGMRRPGGPGPDQRPTLFMNGSEIFAFTLEAVPASIEKLLAKAGLTIGDIDLFVFHQANRYMLDHLRRRMKIPAEKFLVSMSHCGNTVSSSIPIAIRQSLGPRPAAGTMMLVGFGVGYSWGATLVRQ